LGHRGGEAFLQLAGRGYFQRQVVEELQLLVATGDDLGSLAGLYLGFLEARDGFYARFQFAAFDRAIDVIIAPSSIPLLSISTSR